MIAGWSVNYNGDDWRAIGLVPDLTQYDFRNNYTPSPPYTLEPNFNFHSSGWGRTSQVYLYETINLLEGRLSLTGGLSQNKYFGGNIESYTGFRNSDRAEATLPSGGVVYKITPGVSLYYGFTKQDLPGGGDEYNAIPPHTNPIRQREGVGYV